MVNIKERETGSTEAGRLPMNTPRSCRQRSGRLRAALREGEGVDSRP